jgi:hypothetical protein
MGTASPFSPPGPAPTRPVVCRRPRYWSCWRTDHSPPAASMSWGAATSLAGFQVSTPGRFWVSTEAEAERLLYYSLVGALEAGLVRTAEDALTVLRQASQRLGPMGAEWLKRQERDL